MSRKSARNNLCVNTRLVKASAWPSSFRIATNFHPFLSPRNIVRCLGLTRIPHNFPGLYGLQKETWAMLLELCEVRTAAVFTAVPVRFKANDYTDKSTCHATG